MQESRQNPELLKFSDAQLRDELAIRAHERQLGIRPTIRYETKLEWAQAQLADAQLQLEKVQRISVPVGPKLARKQGQLRSLGDNVRKFEKLVQRYTESGE